VQLYVGDTNQPLFIGTTLPIPPALTFRCAWFDSYSWYVPVANTTGTSASMGINCITPSSINPRGTNVYQLRVYLDGSQYMDRASVVVYSCTYRSCEECVRTGPKCRWCDGPLRCGDATLAPTCNVPLINNASMCATSTLTPGALPRRTGSLVQVSFSRPVHPSVTAAAFCRSSYSGCVSPIFFLNLLLPFDLKCCLYLKRYLLASS
jgi:hypothetical protein